MKKNCVKNLIDIFDRKIVLAIFLNGPISKKDIFLRQKHSKFFIFEYEVCNNIDLYTYNVVLVTIIQ